MRPGWVTVGRSLSTSNLQPGTYAGLFRQPDGSVYVENRSSRVPPPRSANLLPQDQEIEALRPKSPPK